MTGAAVELGEPVAPPREVFDDHGRVDAEFAAIMFASGFGDRVIVAALNPRPTPEPTRRGRGASARPLSVPLLASSAGERVRAPPSGDRPT